MADDVGGEKEEELRAEEKQIDSVSIGTEPKEILAANPDRKGYLIQNNGSQDLYLGFSSSVTPSRYSVKLLPRAVMDGDDYKGAWWGRTESGTILVRFAEVT